MSQEHSPLSRTADSQRGMCTNLIFDRSQHLLNRRVGNSRRAILITSVKRLDHQEENRRLPSCATKLRINRSHIGYLNPGQPVEVTVDRFPFQKYGSLRGMLVSSGRATSSAACGRFSQHSRALRRHKYRSLQLGSAYLSMKSITYADMSHLPF
jgi:hypothetical protein